MKNSKKGISLIVLVITIVVIIILAAAVILTLNKNNPIDSAKKSVLLQERDSVESAVQMYIFKCMAENEGLNPLGDKPAEVTLGAASTAPATTADLATSYPKTAISWDDLGITPTRVKAGWKVNEFGKVTAPSIEDIQSGKVK